MPSHADFLVQPQWMPSEVSLRNPGTWKHSGWENAGGLRQKTAKHDPNARTMTPGQIINHPERKQHLPKPEPRTLKKRLSMFLISPKDVECKGFSRGLHILPTWNPMSFLPTPLLSFKLTAAHMATNETEQVGSIPLAVTAAINGYYRYMRALVLPH